MNLYFSDVFEVSKEALDKYGAFNVSLITDLPLFVDPFLLFHSKKKEYQQFHDNIIRYLKFLRDKSTSQRIDEGLLRSWFYFSEVKQNWLGFTQEGNAGRGLGNDFAKALNSNLVKIFGSFGKERITRGTHLEKLCLIRSGVGKDTISDFTTNLIKGYLIEYTQSFTEQNIAPKFTKRIPVSRVRFNYLTERWESDTYTLPFFKGDHVLLTPKDILTKEDTWISRNDFLNEFFEVINAVPNIQLRQELDNYLKSVLKERPVKKDLDKAITNFTLRFPEIIDYYIKLKEEQGDMAVKRSIDKVLASSDLYVERFGGLAFLLASQTEFYAIKGITSDEAFQRIQYLKDVIENKGGWRFLYDKNGVPVKSEDDLHVMYKLTWFGTLLDVSHEVDDGRGPADFKISLGSLDKTIVEFKLAKNPRLRQNLQNQVEIYKRASDARVGYKVIIYFNDGELKKVNNVLEELNLLRDRNIILIDARSKPSASKATGK